MCWQWGFYIQKGFITLLLRGNVIDIPSPRRGPWVELRSELKRKPVEDLQISPEGPPACAASCFPGSEGTSLPFLSAISQTFIFFFYMKQAPQPFMLHGVYVKMFHGGVFRIMDLCRISVLFWSNRAVVLFNSEGLKNGDKITIVKWRGKAAAEMIVDNWCPSLLVCKVLLRLDFLKCRQKWLYVEYLVP